VNVCSLSYQPTSDNPYAKEVTCRNVIFVATIYSKIGFLAEEIRKLRTCILIEIKAGSQEVICRIAVFIAERTKLCLQESQGKEEDTGGGYLYSDSTNSQTGDSAILQPSAQRSGMFEGGGGSS
jgi:hypothetical protein